MNRSEILHAAETLVSRDRHETHGDARQQWEEIAALWSIYAGATITPAMALRMMAQIKQVRAKANPGHVDNGPDACGYDALAAEADADGWGRVAPGPVAVRGGDTAHLGELAARLARESRFPASDGGAA